MEGGRKRRSNAGCSDILPQDDPIYDESFNGPRGSNTINTIKRASKGKWTVEEDEILREAVMEHKGKNWKKIAEHLEGREDTQCLHRWQKVLNPALVKGPWTKEVEPSLHSSFLPFQRLTSTCLFSRWKKIGRRNGDSFSGKAWSEEMVANCRKFERQDWETMP